MRHRSRSWPGTTTNGATPTVWLSWHAKSRSVYPPRRSAPSTLGRGIRARRTTMATVEATAPAKRAGELRNYILVTAAYWSDTLTDGAIRMLVLFYVYQRGYTPSRS